MKSSQPIGIFDSGIGGLTVAKAVKEKLPNERIIYFGDTAHLPYGDKSAAAIQAYSVKVSEMLLQRKCKVILIACNSASSAAFELVTEYVGRRAKVLDVINPTIHLMREEYGGRRIGLIGTKQTVASRVYEQKIGNLNLGIELQALATPLLAHMIEEGFKHDAISYEIIKNYLNSSSLAQIEALILGCTHYPIIKREIGDYYTKAGRDVSVLDSAEVIASSLAGFLEYNQMKAKANSEEDLFLVSDYTKSFENTTKIFFGEEVQLAKVPIWQEMS